VHVYAEKTSDALLAVSFCGLALFVPFSISGVNISIALGFLGALIGLVGSSRMRARFAAAKTDPMLGACALLVVSALPSVFMSENAQRALSDWQSYWILLVYFYVAYGLWSRRARRVVYWILLGSTALSCLVAFAQYGGGLDLRVIRISAQPRPSSTLFIMTFAGILAQLVTVNFAVIFRRGRLGRLEWLVGGALVLQVIAILLTHTRGAWVALAAGIGTVTVLLKKRGPWVVAGVLVAAVVAFAAADSRIRDKIISIPQTVRGPTDVNVSTRFVLWDISWELIKRHPIVGVGMGDFSIEAEKLVGERHTETVTDAHNIYLQVLATRGMVGFIPFVYFWFVLLRTLARARQRTAVRSAPGPAPFGFYFASGVLGAAVALLVGALTENNIDDSEVFTAFMLLAGMARSFSLYPDRAAPSAIGEPEVSEAKASNGAPEGERRSAGPRRRRTWR
jgi:O-antigen ligase